MAKQKMKSKLIQSARQEFNKASLEHFKLGESYMSLLLGAVVVIAGVLIVVSVIKTARELRSATQTETPVVQVTKKEEKKTEQKINTYTVLEGESLSDIATKLYGDDKKWTDIASLNNISDPNSLYKGQVLKLPVSTPTKEVSSTSTTAEEQKAINGTSYTVQEGDLLWDIAVRAYGDGFKWQDIAKANNLPTPDAISAGQTLKLPRTTHQPQ